MSLKERALNVIASLGGRGISGEEIKVEGVVQTKQEQQPDMPRARGVFTTRTVAGRYKIPTSHESDIIESDLEWKTFI